MTEIDNRIAPHPPLREYYPTEEARRRRVDGMFDASAGHYDWINSVMSLGSGEWYRRQALARAGVAPGMRVLDVGSGRMIKDQLRVFVHGMLLVFSSVAVGAMLVAANLCDATG